LRLKEFLSVRGIEFQSVNVLEDEAGRAELARLGVRSIPVLTQGERYVFGQSLADIVGFLGLAEQAGPTLPASELIARLDRALGLARDLIGQLPDALLAREVPNRPRSYRLLAHHIFRIPEAFLETAAGAALTANSASAPPPEEMVTTAEIVAYGEDVRRRLGSWWDAEADRSGARTVATYYGAQSLHEVLERTTWHSMQHVRQWEMLLDMAGIAPMARLSPQECAGLPMPKEVWDS